MSSSDPPEKWDRVLAAVKASQEEIPSPAPAATDASPPNEFSTTLLGRVRAFHASLATWQRWSLIAGVLPILLFAASLIYLKATSPNEAETPIIEMPGLELPEPSPTNPEHKP